MDVEPERVLRETLRRGGGIDEDGGDAREAFDIDQRPVGLGAFAPAQIETVGTGAHDREDFEGDLAFADFPERVVRFAIALSACAPPCAAQSYALSQFCRTTMGSDGRPRVISTNRARCQANWASLVPGFSGGASIARG